MTMTTKTTHSPTSAAVQCSGQWGPTRLINTEVTVTALTVNAGACLVVNRVLYTAVKSM